jgi:hypothetical protein
MSIIKSLIDRIEHAVEPAEEQAMDYEAGEGKRTAASGQEERAATVSLADFSEQLTSGVLRAVDERAARLGRPKGGGDGPIGPRDPWIWCGYWIKVGGDIKLDTQFDRSGFE